VKRCLRPLHRDLPANPGFTMEVEVVPNRIAEPILKGFRDQDVIVFTHQLQSATFHGRLTG
jgi:hypothetical protein